MDTEVELKDEMMMIIPGFTGSLTRASQNCCNVGKKVGDPLTA